MPANSEKSCGSMCSKFGIKPLTGHNIMFYYAPLQGVLSYTSLSINVMNPALILRIFPRRDITNILLFNTILGTGLYLYNRPHIQLAQKKRRFIYSTFGAVIFSLGSVLFWAIERSIIPDNVVLCTFCGIGTGMALIKFGTDYIRHLDSIIVK